MWLYVCLKKKCFLLYLIEQCIAKNHWCGCYHKNRQKNSGKKREVNQHEYFSNRCCVRASMICRRHFLLFMFIWFCQILFSLWFAGRSVSWCCAVFIFNKKTERKILCYNKIMTQFYRNLMNFLFENTPQNWYHPILRLLLLPDIPIAAHIFKHKIQFNGFTFEYEFDFNWMFLMNFFLCSNSEWFCYQFKRDFLLFIPFLDIGHPSACDDFRDI